MEFMKMEWLKISTSNEKNGIVEMMPSSGFECDWNGWYQVEMSRLVEEKKKRK